jgi:nanoRNase/pAp phosphatase (c-di-AMP/oligoRNAs hydrolase)
VEWGLRSRDFDVGSLAKALGGGGHEHSAGFIRMSKTENIIDIIPTEEK